MNKGRKKSTTLSTTTEPSQEIQVKSQPGMHEIDFLAIFCDNFEQYDHETRQRIADYIHSRYNRYFSL